MSPHHRPSLRSAARLGTPPQQREGCSWLRAEEQPVTLWDIHIKTLMSWHRPTPPPPWQRPGEALVLGQPAELLQPVGHVTSQREFWNF